MNILNIQAGDKLCFINDVHISKEDIQSFKDNWEECLSVCVTEGAKNIVLGGDLFESRPSQTLSVLSTIQWAIYEASNRGINVIMANGNHDKVDQESELGYCHIYKEHPNVTVIDTWGVIETPYANIFVLAYFPEDGSLREKLSDIISSNFFNNGKRNVLYAHAGVLGALGRDNDNEIDKASFKDFSVVYMGHYHGRSSIGNVEYIGSSRQYTYGEDYIKGYNICNSEGDLKFIQNNVNIRRTTKTLPFKEAMLLTQDTVDNIKSEVSSGVGIDKVKLRLIVECTPSESVKIDRDKLRGFGADMIEFKTNILESDIVVNTSLYKRFDREQIVDNYKSFCKTKKYQPEIGVKYLKGK